MSSVRSLFVFFILCLFLGTSFAAFSAEDFITGFQTKEATLSSVDKGIFYKKVLANLSLIIKNSADSQEILVLNRLKAYVTLHSKNTLSGTLSPVFSPDSFSASGMHIPHVDLEKVRTVRLQLHNTERATKSLTPFTYSPALEGTASTWAAHLADIHKTSHKRKNTDGYYSYFSIKAWFADQGISFLGKEIGGQPLFTENLGWNMYSCQKDDCTDDFIKAIKKSRSFFMSEKGKSYRPHYNAIMGTFSSIGLGVGIAGNKYYLVTHYTQALQ